MSYVLGYVNTFISKTFHFHNNIDNIDNFKGNSLHY